MFAIKLSNISYSKHIIDIGPDINPFMKKAIESGKLFDFKYFLGAFILPAYLYYFLQSNPSGNWADFFLGLFVFSQLVVFTTSIINIFIFSYLNKNREQLEGKVIYGKEFSYLKSASINFTYICIFIVLFFFLKSYLLVGGIVAFLANIFSNYVWYKKSNK